MDDSSHKWWCNCCCASKEHTVFPFLQSYSLILLSLFAWRDWLMRWHGIVICLVIVPSKCRLCARLSSSREKDANSWQQTCPDRPGHTGPPDPQIFAKMTFTDVPNPRNMCANDQYSHMMCHITSVVIIQVNIRIFRCKQTYFIISTTNNAIIRLPCDSMSLYNATG